jgi:hypothetical protein
MHFKHQNFLLLLFFLNLVSFFQGQTNPAVTQVHQEMLGLNPAAVIPIPIHTLITI